MKARVERRRLDALPMRLAVAIGLSAGAAVAAALLLHAGAWAAGGLLGLTAAAVVLAASGKPVAVPEGQSKRWAWPAAFAVSAAGMGAVAAMLYQHNEAHRPAPAKLEAMVVVIEEAMLSVAVLLPAPADEPVPPALACPEGMLPIPGGTFMMGSPEGKGGSDEHPQHKVELSPYCMDKTEVTVAQYAQCVNEERNGVKCTPADEGGNCNRGKPDKANHPINCVDWKQADAYCRWAGGELPAEAQWEFAARGTDGREYPWGNEPPSNQLCWDGDGSDLGRGNRYSTCAIGSHPKDVSPFELLDMAGNVWEWTADWYGAYKNAPNAQRDPKGPESPDIPGARVVRGGGWDYYFPSDVRAASRSGLALTNRSSDVGFRCARGPNQ